MISIMFGIDDSGEYNHQFLAAGETGRLRPCQFLATDNYFGVSTVVGEMQFKHDGWPTRYTEYSVCIREYHNTGDRFMDLLLNMSPEDVRALLDAAIKL